MATIVATGNGNWSSTTPDAPWPSGTLPGSGDDVSSGEFVVTIDQNITVASLYSVGYASGYFEVSSGERTVNADVYGGSAAGQGTVYISGGTCNIIGDVYGGVFDEYSSQHGVYNDGGTLNVVGNVAGGSASSSAGIFNAGICAVTGNLTPGIPQNSFAIFNISDPIDIDGSFLYLASAGTKWFSGSFRLVESIANTITVLNTADEEVVYSSSTGTGISNVTIVIGGNVVRR